MQRLPDTRCGSLCLTIGIVLLGLVVLGPACSPKPKRGEVEEEERAAANVPAVVREAAESLAQRIGNGHCDRWFEDHEDNDWECEFVGLDRAAELDVLPDGRFSELELVYSLDEVNGSLPEEAALIRHYCRDTSDVLIELSLRREVLLDEIPELTEAWKQSGVVMEFQCPGGIDYEIDARHNSVVTRMDDKEDASTHEKRTD